MRPQSDETTEAVLQLAQYGAWWTFVQIILKCVASMGLLYCSQISNWKIVCIKHVWELFCESMDDLKDLHWNVHYFFIKNTFYWRDRLLLTHHSQFTNEIYVFFCFYFYFFGEGVASVVLKLKWNKHQERCSQETQWTQGWNNMWTERVEQR